MRILALLPFLFYTFYVQAQSKYLPSEVIATIRERIDEGKNPGIVIGIIDKDGPRFYAFGTTKDKGKPVDEHTIYEIGSISKVFTSTLLADLITKGEMRATDPANKYLPSTGQLPSYEGEEITLGHLSDHTSSLPRLPSNLMPADPSNPYADFTVEQMYACVHNVQLERPIGSQYEYSNLAVGLLGQILALKTGKSYEVLLQEVITMPLGMNETGITLTKKMQKQLAPGHYQGEIVPNWDMPAIAGAGAIRSSVHDMLIFLKAHMQLSPSLLQEALSLTQMPRHDKTGHGSIGLGWFIDKTTNGEIVYHNGATGGYNSFAGFNKATGRGVVVLTNSEHAADDIGLHLIAPDIPIRAVKPHVASRLKEIIDSEGPEDLMSKYDKLKEDAVLRFEFNEAGINDLGYYYLNRRQYNEAQQLFLLNIREYPTSANAYDSYAESLMENGQTELAIDYYRQSLAINPGNVNAVDMLAKMGVTYEHTTPEIDTAILASYEGVYQLVPGFDLAITRNGNQLTAQATGQGAYAIFPKDETTFYYKIVDAQIVFSANEKGKVESLTLYQSGTSIPGKKVK